MAGMWTPPEGATPEQFPHGRNPLDGTARMAALLAEIKTLLGDMPGHLLEQAGLRVEPGKFIIEGDLEVIGGIKNEQLAHPVVPTQFSALTTAWGVPTSAWYTLATATVPVPTGFTQALVIANGFWRITYTVAGSQMIGGRCSINSVAGDEGDVDMTPSTSRSLSTFQTSLLTGLGPTDTVAASVQIDTPDVSGANANNRARISGVVIWLR